MKADFITGGSRRIGKAMVEEFSAAGYAVAFTYSSNTAAANDLVECLRSQGRTAFAYQADVRDFNRAKEVVEQAHKDAGEIVTLINNAGIKRDGAFASMSPEALTEVVDNNLNGGFNYTPLRIRVLMIRLGTGMHATR